MWLPIVDLVRALKRCWRIFEQEIKKRANQVGLKSKQGHWSAISRFLLYKTTAQVSQAMFKLFSLLLAEFLAFLDRIPQLSGFFVEAEGNKL